MDHLLPFLWLFIAVAAVVTEAFTVSLVSIWFVPSALISMILAFCGVPYWLQIPVFLILSVLLIVLMKPIAKKMLGVKYTATNADALIGERAVVTEEINNLEAKGQVKIRGQVWTARAHDQTKIYEKGEVLNVIAIEGVKLICKKSD